jgi:hypothetical protein
VIPERLISVWNAFFDLSGDRSIGFGSIGRIPFSAINAYAQRYRIDDIDRFERFSSLIRSMDAAFIEHHVKKSKAQ